MVAYLIPKVAEKEVKVSKKKEEISRTRSGSNYLLTWGQGRKGVLGHDCIKDVEKPKVVSFFQTMRVMEVAAGTHHALIRTEIDGVYSMGMGKDGRLGLGPGDVRDRKIPCRINSLNSMTVLQLAAGREHSAALVEYRSELPADPDDRIPTRVYTWGNGDNGRLGHGNVESLHAPKYIEALCKFVTVQLVCGGSHTMCLSTEFIESTGLQPLKRSGGSKKYGSKKPPSFSLPKKKPEIFVVFSFGWNLYGQLGHGDNWDVLLPKQIVDLKGANIEKIGAGDRSSTALSSPHSKANPKRHVYVWGHGVHPNVLEEPIHASIQCTLVPRLVMGMQDSIAKDLILGSNCGFLLTIRGAFKVGQFVEDPCTLHPGAHKWTRGSVRKIISTSTSVQEKVLEALRMKHSKFHGRELVSIPAEIVLQVPALEKALLEKALLCTNRTSPSRTPTKARQKRNNE